MVSARRPAGCTNASVVFGWIVATLLHHTRDRKVERKFFRCEWRPNFEVEEG